LAGSLYEKFGKFNWINLSTLTTLILTINTSQMNQLQGYIVRPVSSTLSQCEKFLGPFWRIFVTLGKILDFWWNFFPFLKGEGGYPLVPLS
jgi:hypothetical protein